MPVDVELKGVIKDIYKPQRITVAVLNYIPFLGGFYADMLNVLKKCIGSIRDNSDLPFDLLVFDNNSCQEVRDYLTQQKESGAIQLLYLSRNNLGKGGAWNIIFEMAPGEIIAYTDNDCCFFSGWLSKSVKILDLFPNVGMVTSRPFWTSEKYNSKTIEWAKQTPSASFYQGKFLDWETYRSFTMSLGIDEATVQGWYDNHEDLRVDYKGMTAQIGASHYQFLAYKRVLQTFLPFQMDRPMGQVRQLDVRMNDAGYLRLMTTEALMQNMSNQASLSSIGAPRNFGSKIQKWVMDFPLVKKPLLWVYNRIYQIYTSK
jgi:glycosyltransferase involved in cell wall biosynthesis